jgi:6-phosphogluconolactonase
MAPTPRPSELRRPDFVCRPVFLTRACALTAIAALTLLSGCGSFFQCEGKASCPVTCTATITTNCTGGTGTGTGTGSSTTDYAYVANSSTSNQDIDGYNVGAGTLTTATSAPFSFGYVPSSMVVTPANTFLYAATDAVQDSGHGYIYGYSIGTGGALSILSNGASLIPGEDISSLAVSPDGQWLFCLDDIGTTLEEYSINASTGALTFAATYIVGPVGTGLTATPAQVTIAPSGDFVVVALGQGGAETYSLDETTGAATAQTLLTPSSASTGIFAAAVDVNNNLYLAGTAGLSVYSVTNTGVPTQLNTYATGSGADHSVVVNAAGTYVYAGNQSTGTIYGFSIGTNAALTAISGSPFTGPTTLNAMAFDSTDAYLIASGYNATTGIQLFTLGTTGALTSAGTAGTGTSALIPGAIATTH